MNIDKNQIIDLLKSQGHPHAEQAGQELPDQLDTGNPDHAGLLAKFGLDAGDLGGKLGGLGKLR